MLQDKSLELYMPIGENLKRLRRDKKWTQGELSDKCGIRLGQISKIERNDTDPKLSTIYSIINALECTPNALLNDVSKTNVDSLLAMVLERVQSLDGDDKRTILDVIDNYCTARNMQHLLEKKTVFGMSIMLGKNEELKEE